MLLTLQQFDEQEARRASRSKRRRTDEDRSKKEKRPKDEEKLHQGIDRPRAGGREAADGQLAARGRRTRRTPQFRRALPDKGLEITKTYRLAKVPDESLADDELSGLSPGVRDRDSQHRRRGPQGGLSARRAQRSAHRRQVVCHKVSRARAARGCATSSSRSAAERRTWSGPRRIADGKDPAALTRPDKPLTFIGVDAQYFSAVLMPQRENPADVWFDELMPIRVGKVDPQHTNLDQHVVPPDQQGARAEAGRGADATASSSSPARRSRPFWQQRVSPGRADLLRLADLRRGRRAADGDPARLLRVVPNYGLAIILLTVLVRGCMFPLSLQAGRWACRRCRVAAGDQEDPGEVQEQRRGPDQGPAGIVPQAQLQSAERLPADLHPDAGVHRACTGR